MSARGTRAAASTASQPATSASSAARIVRPTRTTPTIIPLCRPGGSRDISASAAALPPASLSPASAHLPPPLWPTWINSSVPSCALRKPVSRVSSVFSPRISSDAYGCCSVRHARATRGAGAGRSGSGRGGGANATAGGGTSAASNLIWRRGGGAAAGGGGGDGVGDGSGGVWLGSAENVPNVSLRGDDGAASFSASTAQFSAD